MAVPSIPFARPNIGKAEEEAVLRVLRSGWLTTGKETLGFEQEFSSQTGSKHSLAVNSATSGLHLALEAIGIKQGDYIAVSPYTFTASTEVMRYLGAHPLFIDIAEGTFHMDPHALSVALERGKAGKGPMPAAIMAVHIGGLGHGMDEIYELAALYGIRVIEDAAHAFPARLDANAPTRAQAMRAVGQPDPYLGLGGDIGVYSFYANKTITTGEGGMVCCNDDEQAQRMKIMRSHGIDRDVWNRFTSNAQQWRYAVVEAGYKYNLPDMAGALGRVQLARADELMEQRRKIVARYCEAFKNIEWIMLPPGTERIESHPQGHSWHLFSIRIIPGPGLMARDQWVGKLQDLGIGTSVHYIPLHLMPYYQKTYNLQAQDFPRSLEAYEQVLSLPLWAGLGEDDVERVIEGVLGA